jgi:hypothetical protein
VNDPWEELLLPFEQPDSSALRQALLAQTVRLLPRRRRWRVLAAAGALAACFVLGMLTMWQLRPAPADRPTVAEEKQPALQAPPPKAPLTRGTALVREWQAFDSKGKERAALFTQAGAQYLHDDHNPDAALRCYRQALAAATPDELEVRPEDDWLVMALKTARKQEIVDAKNVH